MRDRLAIIVGVALFIRVATGAETTNGPVYQGRPLTDWLQDFSNPGLMVEAPRPGVMEKSQQARVAILEMGTNVIPALLNILHNKTSPESGLWFDEPRMSAGQAIALFGGQAKFALPDLVELLRTETNISYPEAVALGAIGPDAIPPLCPMLTNSAQLPHRGAAAAFAHICGRYFGQPVLSNAMSALTYALRHEPDMEVRTEIAQTMSLVRISNAIPAMLESLSDPNLEVREAIINALAYYDYDEKTVIAALEKVRDNDPDPTMKIIAARAIADFQERLKWKPTNAPAR